MWDGDLPDGVRRIEPLLTPRILVGGRTLVDGPEDVPNARAIQQQYKLTPSACGEPTAKSPETRQRAEAKIQLTADPLGPGKTLNAMLKENPPPAERAILLKQFATIGIGPGLDVDAAADNVKETSYARSAPECSY